MPRQCGGGMPLPTRRPARGPPTPAPPPACCPQPENIVTLTKAAGIEVEPYWPALFAKLIEKKSVEDFIVNVGAGEALGLQPAAAATARPPAACRLLLVALLVAMPTLAGTPCWLARQRTMPTVSPCRRARRWRCPRRGRRCARRRRRRCRGGEEGGEG